MREITITRPDDCHLHVRDGAMLRAVIAHSAETCARAVIMPNLKPPITTLEAAEAYRDRIFAACPEHSDFLPLMTLYLTDRTSVEEIRRSFDSGIVRAVKLYPAGATTNADYGVSNCELLTPVFECMAELGMPLLIHGEVVDQSVDIFDREARFIEDILDPLHRRIPELKIVMEHVTTAQAVKYVLSQDGKLAATITPQHLLMNRNSLFAGGLHPHHYCLPVLKRETHRQALLAAISSGSPKFFMGTDSAPHPKMAKESPCGCAGIYTAFAALPLYAEAFEEVDALSYLDAFCSKNGAAFYGLKKNTGMVRLVKETWTVPDQFDTGTDDVLVPLRAGQEIAWKVHSVQR